MLSLSIIFMLFGALLPLLHDMQQSIHYKKERAAAFETMHEAAKTMAATGETSGSRTVNETVYTWEFAENLCVSFLDYRQQEETICLE